MPLISDPRYGYDQDIWDNDLRRHGGIRLYNYEAEVDFGYVLKDGSEYTYIFKQGRETKKAVYRGGRFDLFVVAYFWNNYEESSQGSDSGMGQGMGQGMGGTSFAGLLRISPKLLVYENYRRINADFMQRFGACRIFLTENGREREVDFQSDKLLGTDSHERMRFPYRIEASSEIGAYDYMKCDVLVNAFSSGMYMELGQSCKRYFDRRNMFDPCPPPAST